MSEVIQSALLGLGIGAVYGLSALGLVAVFRASGVLNFAGGAMGAVAAFLFYDLRDRGWSTGVALPLVLLVGVAIAAGSQWLVMGRLRGASAVTRLIVTLALFSGLQGVVTLIWGQDTKTAESILPDGTVTFGGDISVPESRIWLFGIAIVLGLAMWFVYSRTMFGLATSAVAENRRSAASMGWSSGRIELLNWGIGGAVYALTAVLLAPIVGLGPATLALLILPALAAALVGGFASFPLALIGGIVIGVIEAELTRYVQLTGISSSVPFLVIVAVIIAGGRARPTRSDLPARLPVPGRGRIRPLVVAFSVAALGVFIWTVSASWIDATTTTFVTGLLVLSVVVVTGLGGQLSLGQWALGGIGALIAGRLVAGAGLPFELAALLGVLATLPVGLLVALPALRTRGVNLGIVTLALALAIQAVILSNETLTGGVYGTAVGSPHLFGLDLDPIVYPERYASLVVGIFALLALAVANLRRGRTGRRMLAVRSNERVAASLGISVYGLKLYAFGLAALIAGFAGVLSAFRNPNLVFTDFDVFGSINAVIYAVIGGVGWVAGVIPGALMAPAGLLGKPISDIGINKWLPVISAFLLIATVMGARNGVAALYAGPCSRLLDGASARILRRRPRWVTEGQQLLEAEVTSGTRRRDPVTLRIEGLGVRYGGIVALENVNLVVRPGEVTGLIGPNGAGKTSLLDAISGFARPTSGTLRLDDTIINGWSVERRARAGLSRAFQAVELFPEMTVAENLLVASEQTTMARVATDLVRPGKVEVSPAVREAVETFELARHLDVMPSELPHGTARLVGIARGLANDASVLLLDEPAAGLDSHEREELSGLITRIAREQNVAVLLVEHDVELIMRTCDRITVLDFGRVIAEGTPAEVQTNDDVRRAYLGVAGDEGQASVATLDGPTA